nr:PREDICTED: serine/arginine repetitive matrix protein 2 isoform X2 [Bemisia tabaci]
MEQDKPGNAKKEKLEVLAPFASLEDLSPESPLAEHFAPSLPQIPEEQKKMSSTASVAASTATPAPPPGSNNNNNSLGISSTPRIDISRASSSSHQDDSSPERELFGEKSGDGSNGVKLGLGFSEEMAAELRSSTEELDFQDPNEIKRRRSTLQTQQAIFDPSERKDSTCSVDFGFLSISGRQSRLSSIGSGGSAASGGSHYSAASHYSNASHLSAMSNLSKASRGSSPHRMLVETSFCGPKPLANPAPATAPPAKPPEAAAENKLVVMKSNWVGRSHSAGSADTRERQARKEEKEHRRHRSVTPKIDDPKTQRFVSLFSEDSVDNSAEAFAAHTAAAAASRAPPKFENSDLVKFVSLYGTSTESANGVPPPQGPAQGQSQGQPQAQPQAASQKNQGHAQVGHAGHRVTRPIPVPCPKVPTPAEREKQREKEKQELQNFSSEIKYMKPFTNKTLKNFIANGNGSGGQTASSKMKMIQYDKDAKHLFISLKEDKVEKLPDFPSAANGTASSATAIPAIGLEPASPPGEKKTTMEIDNKTQIFISLHEDPPGWTPPSRTQHISPAPSLQSRRSRTPELDAEPLRAPSRDRSRDSRDRSRDSRDRSRDSRRESRDNEPLVKIIPLHAGDDDDEDSNRLRVVNYAAGSEIRSLPSIPLYSLDIESGAKVYTLDLNNYADSRPARSMSQLREATRTPSPSSKYNFFRRNSESAKGCRAKSDSGSRSRKSSIFGIFKRSNSIRSNKSRSPSIEPSISNTDFNYKQSQLHSHSQSQSQTKRYNDTADTIIIPLHSPDSDGKAPVSICGSTNPAEECDIRPASEFETPSKSQSGHRADTSVQSPASIPNSDSMASGDENKGRQNITTTAEIVTHSEDALGKLKRHDSRRSSEETSQGQYFTEPIEEPIVERKVIAESTSTESPLTRSRSNELKRIKRESMEKLKRIDSTTLPERDELPAMQETEVPEVRPETPAGGPVDMPVGEPEVLPQVQETESGDSEFRRSKRGKSEDRRRRESSRSRGEEHSERRKSREEHSERRKSRGEHSERRKSKEESLESRRSRKEHSHSRKSREDSSDSRHSREESADSRKSKEETSDRRKSRDESFDRRKSREEFFECMRTKTESPPIRDEFAERRRSREESTERLKSKIEGLESRISREASAERGSSRAASSERTKSREEPPNLKSSREERDDLKSSKEDADEPKSKSSESGSEINLKMEDAGDDIEKKSLVNQPESLEDELPYVPTTLPLERVDLSCEKVRVRSPSQPSSWQELAEQVQSNSRRASSASTSPPPLPPRMSTFHPTRPAPMSAPPIPSPAPWVSFEEMAERRRSPKKITTLPARHSPATGASRSRSRSRNHSHNVNSAAGTGSGAGSTTVYNYVNPEDCSCECHDSRIPVDKKQTPGHS